MEYVFGVSVQCERRVPGQSASSGGCNEFGLLIGCTRGYGSCLDDVFEGDYCVSCVMGALMFKGGPISKPDEVGV